ncbi:conserved hypothetical protein; putative exported protein; putative outer membrane anchored protein [Cupriavidus taiwanensis]|uniref:Uncharacterized protein n=1 Tax=Cupriavidus taiwanensis TaxID=164546 RepID=A0A375B7S5_9BURK|nr:hypothetical protein [Cupriavidus taiwanensis]SOY39646.1 conserved hypothetical protein; putative exported protein; putative outer membrane anchored protein [Cupriavidus taiwanensis]
MRPNPHHRREAAAAAALDALTRRGFLKVGLGLSAALACTALLPALAGCSSAAPAPHAGMSFLRPDDVAMFRALLPAIVTELAEAPPPRRAALEHDALRNIDATCAAMGAGAQAELRKLFGLLASTPLRWALTGIRQDWSAATPAQVQAFLARWRASRLATLNAGAVVLVKLASVGYYVLPAAWAGSGYPGPNSAIYQALHA